MLQLKIVKVEEKQQTAVQIKSDRQRTPNTERETQGEGDGKNENADNKQ